MSRPVSLRIAFATAAAVGLLAGTAIAGFAGSDVFLPMAGRQAGVHPSNWYTTVWIHNPGSQSATARVWFLQRNTANPSPPYVDVMVAGGDTEKLDNVVEEYFHVEGFGALRVTCPAKLVVTSRVYSKGIGLDEKDSVGQDFAGVPASFAIAVGEKAQVLGVYQTQPSASSEFRFNFGFVETTGHTTNVRVSVYDDDGAQQGTKDFQVREYSQRQVAFKDHFPGVSTENARLEFEVISGSGKVIAYGSGIASTSQDPTTFEMSYPDTALGIAAVQHDSTLTGDGTGSTPLGIAPSATAGQVLATVAGGGGAAPGETLAAASNAVEWKSLSALPLGLTPGGVVFGTASGGLGQNPTSLVWEIDDKQLGIGVSAPRDRLDVDGNIRLSATTDSSGVFIIGDHTFLHGYGNHNAFVGPAAGNFTTTASSSTAVGLSALHSLTSGHYNTAVGAMSLYSNTEGEGNAALGYESLKANTTGIQNTAVGEWSLRSNTSGVRNVAVGWLALADATEAIANTAVGAQSLRSATTGGGNSALGEESLRSNTTGTSNVAVGLNALLNNTDGSSNTALGSQAGYSSTGSGNVLLGSNAGYYDTGSNHLHVANSASSTLIYGEFDNNRVAINGINPTTTLDVNGSVRVRGLAGVGLRTVQADENGVLIAAPVFSDARLKRDVSPLAEGVDVLAAVSALRGVSYSWDTTQEPVSGFGDRREIGLLAQDVERVLPELVSADREGYKTVDYAHLTAFLVEVAKAQQLQIEALRAELAALRH